MIRFLTTLVFSAYATLACADVRVIDGDTLELNGKVIRLNGIDAPEHGQRCGAWECGADATDGLVEMVKGRRITCEPISTDSYGRIIATCFANGQDVGGAMVDKGLAWAFRRYSDTYAEAEDQARAQSSGIWQGRYTPPWEFRSARWSAATRAEPNAPRDCPIKGNISKNGRIYHAPWSPWYARTRINTSKGERWFCTEGEALAAGWRAPYWD